MGINWKDDTILLFQKMARWRTVVDMLHFQKEGQSYGLETLSFGTEPLLNGRMHPATFARIGHLESMLDCQWMSIVALHFPCSPEPLSFQFIGKQ